LKETKTRFLIEMELAEGGTLEDFIKNMEKHNFCRGEL
jgi:hypothetical protein